MKIMLYVIGIVIVLVIALGAYVRLAPLDAARWHVPVAGAAAGANSAVAALGVDPAALDAVIRATPRTRVLAGSLEEGRITYVTRSALWGFPDFTTLEVGPDGVSLWSRARDGQSDMGVNAARIEAWRAQMP